MCPISLFEVEEAIMSLATGKSPRMDDVTFYFFHHCWPIVQMDVWALVSKPQRISRILPALNATFVTLIPKEAQATDPSQFRPIALCNVIYKIITKVLASCLKPLMPLLMGPEQSDYVEDCQIIDNIILANQVVLLRTKYQYSIEKP